MDMTAAATTTDVVDETTAIIDPDTTTTTEVIAPLPGDETTTTAPADIPVFTFDGKPLDDVEIPEETPREREMRLELETLRQQQTRQADRPQAITAEPQRPSRDDFYGDDEGYEAAFEAYLTDRSTWQAQQQKATEAQAAHEQQFKDSVSRYMEGRAAITTKLPNFAAVEKHVDNNLNPNLVGAILMGGSDGTFPNPQAMVYAIGKNPELMKKLNGLHDPILAGAMLLDISNKASFAPDAPANNINPVPTVSGAGVTGLEAELEAAEKEAEKTGDRTKVIEIRSRINEAKSKK